MKSEEKIITIDGPSASGKGNMARLLANYFNFSILDSGILYRAYAYFYNEKECKESIKSKIINLNIKIENNTIAVYDNKKNITKELRSEQIAIKASDLSSYTETRSNLLDIQRSMNDEKGLIADGRDMGTVVFPNAKNKFFLTASLSVRANRRYKELLEAGIKVELDDIYDSLERRDNADKNRDLSPLKPAKDSNIIDTSSLSIEDVFNNILSLIKK